MDIYNITFNYCIKHITCMYYEEEFYQNKLSKAVILCIIQDIHIFSTYWQLVTIECIQLVESPPRLLFKSTVEPPS